MIDTPAAATPPPAIEAVMREQALAVGYASASAREGFAALLDLDHQLASILQSTTEPMIGQMRLTWWYEVLEMLDREPVPAHPVLQRLAASVLPSGVRGADLAPMIEGWEALLDDGEPLDDTRVERHAEARGGVLFASIGRLLGQAGMAPLGAAWAKAAVAPPVPDVATRARLDGGFVGIGRSADGEGTQDGSRFERPGRSGARKPSSPGPSARPSSTCRAAGMAWPDRALNSEASSIPAKAGGIASAGTLPPPSVRSASRAAQKLDPGLCRGGVKGGVSPHPTPVQSERSRRPRENLAAYA